MSSYEVARSTTIAAPPAEVQALVDDFHAWTRWSPWEDIDPDVHRTYAGPDRGVGARYAWKGNRKAGEGAMEVIASTPERVEIDLAFLKPWKATSDVAFELAPTAGGTEVTWRMRGEQTGLAGVIARLLPMEKMLAKDFDKGLARLKAVAENA
ncbi:SRPBCC family protein [Nocardioides sp. GCM10027113]|uniref:SRPBCC family protein n=1 Tax=unclassified Nocardioides TaxID=2615069 RepID=UPI00361F4378